MNQILTAFSSSTTTDKIVGVYEGSFDTSAAPTFGGFIPYTTISHGFARPTFTKALFSKDSIVWSDANSYSPFDSVSTLGISYSTDTNLYILLNAVGGVVHYRLIAFWIDDYDTTNPSIGPTIGSQSNTYFDSRLNYQKVFKQSSFTNPAATSATYPILHNLGYTPNVRVFVEMLPGQVWPANFGGTKNPWLYNIDMVECEVQATTIDISIITYASVASAAAKIWYVIYYDS